MDHRSVEQFNQTPAEEFFLMGFSSHPELQTTFFMLFLLIYLMALLGNCLIISVIRAVAHLHTPMYFFLVNLAILDICCTSSTIPYVLQNLLSKTKSISFAGCLSQLFLLSSVIGTELLLLTVMALDRYVAICLPLRYAEIMHMKFCVYVVITMWCIGVGNSIMHSTLLKRLSFYGRIELDHYFCEFPPVLRVSATDTFINDLVILVCDVFLGMICFVLTALSYTYIISTIMKMSSAANKQKAFSTCSSHILVVTLFYGGIIYTYLRPYFNVASDNDKNVSAVYAFVSPVMNPLIYSLRNKEVKDAFNRIISRKKIVF